MKIWYQSGTSIGKDARYNEYKIMLESYLNSVAGPDTEVSVHGVETCSPNIEVSRYEALLHHYQIAENLLQAQRENYDAFCVGCMFDPAFYAIREIADIPVCTLAENSMLLACMLSPNFSLLSFNRVLLLRVIELVKRYGLQQRFIECRNFTVDPVEVFEKGFIDPQIVIKPAGDVAREAASKGVGMFVNCDGVLNMIMAKHNIHEIEGIPVLQGGGALVKATEMLVDLKKMGVERSSLGLYTKLPKEDLTSLRKLYGMS